MTSTPVIRLVASLAVLILAISPFLMGKSLPGILWNASHVAERMAARRSNVLGQPLAFFSAQPMTGFYRDGYCRVGPEDAGNHSVAGVMTDEFLDFSASRGNNLRSIGLTAGCSWCLCISRWKEAMLARRNDQDPVVPKVFLQSTDESALRQVDLSDLRKFAMDAPATNGVANGNNH